MNKMTEKQPDWIDNLIEKCFLYTEPFNGTAYIKTQRLEELLRKLPQESTYESGYQKGLKYAIEYIENNHREVDGERYKQELLSPTDK